MTGKNKLVLGAAGVGVVLAAREIFARSKEADLKGHVVMITGGSKGLGIALARRFAKEGCRLIICARTREELEDAQKELQAKGASVIAFVCDVTDRHAVEQTIDDAQRRFGEIDILVNNAGQISVGPLTSMSVENFQSAMDVMFWGVVYPTLALLPSFVKRKRGRIVNITSFGGKVSVPHLVPYSCAKFAATGFSEGIRAELKDQGIQVTTIAPGLLRTGSFVNAKFTGDREAEAKWFSLGASAPGFSMEADEAADQIVDAVKRGESERILTLPAKLLSGFHGLAPSITADILGAAAAAFLPGARGKNEPVAGAKLSFLKQPGMKILLMLGRAAMDRYRQRATA